MKNFNDYIIIEDLNLKICPFIYSFILITLRNEIILNPNNHNMKYRFYYCNNKLFIVFCNLTGIQANISANIINSFLFKTSFWKIPMAILRTESYKNIIYTIDLDGKNISLNVKNYKMFIGPIMSRLTGTENENNNINTFTPILHAFLQ